MGVGLLRFNQGDVYQRGLAALAVASLLVAAGAGEGDARSRLRDAKPHTGVAAAHTMPVQGIDVSYWQGNIDWEAARAAGIDFVFIKATEGGDHIDPKFRDNW
jgi:lysozyme